MDPIRVASLVALIAFAYYAIFERRREQHRARRRAARRTALKQVEIKGGLFGGGSVSGRSGTLEVRLESCWSGKHRGGTRILVSGLGHSAGGLSLRRESLGTAIKSFVAKREVETGDPAFDAEFYVQGPAPLALAILQPETRRRLLALLRGHGGDTPVDVTLQSGVLEVQVSENFLLSNDLIPEILESVVQVAQLLVAPPDLEKRIAVDLHREPEAGARLNRLLILASDFKDHPKTRKALRAAARSDPSEEVRLRAAMALGEEGRETLLDLVDHATSDSFTARAVEALGHRLPDEVAEAALRRALSGAKSPRTAEACLAVLGRRGQPGTEGLLLEALGCKDETIAVAAARALGQAGTVASVVALRDAGNWGGPLRGAARQAIAEIQSRLAGAEAGQLSLAKGDGGALALADAEPGTTDVTEAPALLLPDDAQGKSGAKPPPQRPRETS